MKGKTAMLFGMAAMLATVPAQASGFSNEVASPHPGWAMDRDLAMVAPQKEKGQKATKNQAVTQQQAQVQMPSGETMLIMIRSSLLALSQANQTNNYAVLNALGSDSFRMNNPPLRLSDSFASFRANNIDLAPVVLINPQLTSQPVIIDGRLRLVGYFPSQPMQVNFDLTYEPTQAGWKLFGLAVNLNRTTMPTQPGLPEQR